MFKSSTTFKFTSDKKEGEKKNKNDFVPGPGTYAPKIIPKKHAPKITMSKNPRPEPQKYKGPQTAYPLKEYIGKEGPKYSMSTKEGIDRTVEKELARVPEPSRYHPNIYAQFNTLGKKISFHKKIEKKPNANENPGPGQYNDKVNMITKHEDQKHLQMSKTTLKYIENYGKVSHGTAKELLRPSTCPKYGFSEQIIGVDHGLSKEQLKKGKQKELERKKKYLEEQEKFQQQKKLNKTQPIPRVKRKVQEKKQFVELDQPKFGFGVYRKGQDKVELPPQRPKLIPPPSSLTIQQQKLKQSQQQSQSQSIGAKK